MFISYADESGYSGSKYDPQQPIQVLAAVLPNTYNIHRTRKEFDYNLEILRRNRIEIEELKASQIYRGKGAWKNIDSEKRHKIFENYFRWLGNRKHKIIISAIDQKSFFSSENCIKEILKVPYVAGAIHIALSIQKENNTKSNNKGKTILIFDEQKQYQKIVSCIIAKPDPILLEYYKNKEGESPLEQIIDTAYFNSSHYSFLLQVADTTAFVYRRYYELEKYDITESYPGEKQKIEGWVGIINKSKISNSAMYPARAGQEICKFYNSFFPK